MGHQLGAQLIDLRELLHGVVERAAQLGHLAVAVRIEGDGVVAAGQLLGVLGQPRNGAGDAPGDARRQHHRRQEHGGHDDQQHQIDSLDGRRHRLQLAAQIKDIRIAVRPLGRRHDEDAVGHPQPLVGRDGGDALGIAPAVLDRLLVKKVAPEGRQAVDGAVGLGLVADQQRQLPLIDAAEHQAHIAELRAVLGLVGRVDALADDLGDAVGRALGRAPRDGAVQVAQKDRQQQPQQHQQDQAEGPHPDHDAGLDAQLTSGFHRTDTPRRAALRYNCHTGVSSAAAA